MSLENIEAWLYNQIKAIPEFANIDVFFKTDEAYKNIQQNKDVVLITTISDKIRADRVRLTYFQIDILSPSMQKVIELANKLVETWSFKNTNWAYIKIESNEDFTSLWDFPRRLLRIEVIKKITY